MQRNRKVRAERRQTMKNFLLGFLVGVVIMMIEWFRETRNDAKDIYGSALKRIREIEDDLLSFGTRLWNLENKKGRRETMKIPHQGIIHEFMLDYRNQVIAEVWAAIEKDAQDYGGTEVHQRLVFKTLGMRRDKFTGQVEGGKA